MIVDIIDVGSGNIKSIQNWMDNLHIPSNIVNKPIELKSKFVILPGVGSIGPYMDKLRKECFDEAILEHVDNGNRLFGICLGFQLMGNFSHEDGGVEGLGLIDGYTEKLKTGVSHNAWNEFKINTKGFGKNTFGSTARLSKKKIVNGRVFYNHEYGFINNDDNNSANTLIPGDLNSYSALVINRNIIGVQFHPEKSQKTGLELMSIIL